MVQWTCREKRNLIARAACVLTMTLAWPIAATAATFYVDPDWTGPATGAAGTPWRSLDTAAWTTINNALLSEPVTVYFSAREAGSDTNEATTAALNVFRANTTSNRLTMDGNSRYNTNDSSPSWTTNPGGRQFQITSNHPVSTGTGERSNVTVRGFRLIATNGQLVFWWGGHNVIIEDNEASSSAGATLGPGIYFQSTNTIGTSCPTTSIKENCSVYTNLIIRRNYVHDTEGEGIYIGGCNNTVGCVSHNGILIENNTLRNIATVGGEPDAIDIKDGLRNVIVRGNDIRLQTESRDGITLESGAIIERNYIEGAGRIGINFSTYWNRAGATRAGTVIRNNIVVNTGGNVGSGFSSRMGIYIEAHTTGDRYTDAVIYNNTVYRVMSPTSTGTGIGNGGTGTIVRNNIVSHAGTVPFYADPGSLAGHSHNLFYNPGGGTVVNYGSTYTAATISSFDSTSLSADPQFVKTTSPYTAANFQLQDTSTAISRGNAVATFSDDYFGIPRVLPWDIGAIKYSGVGGSLVPFPPLNLRIVP